MNLMYYISPPVMRNFSFAHVSYCSHNLHSHLSQLHAIVLNLQALVDFSVQLPPELTALLESTADPISLENYVQLDASLPVKKNREPSVKFDNPFLDNAVNRIPTIRSIANFSIENNGKVNGYVKFQLQKPDLQEEPKSYRPLRLQSEDRTKDVQQDGESPSEPTPEQQALGMCKPDAVLRNPPDLGLYCKLTPVERKLHRFCMSPTLSCLSLLTLIRCRCVV